MPSRSSQARAKLPWNARLWMVSNVGTLVKMGVSAVGQSLQWITSYPGSRAATRASTPKRKGLSGQSCPPGSW